MEGYILDINKKLLTRVRDGADRPSPQHPACGFTWGVSLKSSGRNRISKLFPFCYCRKSSVTYHPHFCAFVGGLQSNSFIYTPQLAADTLCRRGPGRRSSKSGDPLVKCRVNTLYAKCEEGESEATCRTSLFPFFRMPLFWRYVPHTRGDVFRITSPVKKKVLIQ